MEVHRHNVGVEMFPENDQISFIDIAEAIESITTSSSTSSRTPASTSTPTTTTTTASAKAAPTIEHVVMPPHPPPNPREGHAATWFLICCIFAWIFLRIYLRWGIPIPVFGDGRRRQQFYDLPRPIGGFEDPNEPLPAPPRRRNRNRRRRHGWGTDDE